MLPRLVWVAAELSFRRNVRSRQHGIQCSYCQWPLQSSCTCVLAGHWWLVVGRHSFLRAQSTACCLDCTLQYPEPSKTLYHGAGAAARAQGVRRSALVRCALTSSGQTAPPTTAAAGIAPGGGAVRPVDAAHPPPSPSSLHMRQTHGYIAQ